MAETAEGEVAGESLLESLVAGSVGPGAEARGGARVALPSGRAVSIDVSSGAEVVRFESPTGQIELQVTLTSEGPRLLFQAADVAIKSAGTVAVECKRFEVRAEEGISQASGGDLKETVAGDRASEVGGASTAVARRTLIQSKRGDVKVVANDDVELVGERIKLNC